MASGAATTTRRRFTLFGFIARSHAPALPPVYAHDTWVKDFAKDTLNAYDFHCLMCTFSKDSHPH